MLQLLVFIIFLAFSTVSPVYASTVIELPIEEDTYIEEKFPTISPWNNRNLFLGTDAWYAKGKNRILLKPDFSQLQDRDILYTDIEKVELILTSYEYEGTDQSATIDTYTTTTPWSMFSVTWTLQPGITTKKDSSVISTSPGVKTIQATAAFTEAYKTYPSIEKGILLKINAETEKAIIFWAHGCDIAPAPPICSGSQDRPRFVITTKANNAPSPCTLKLPTPNLVTNNPTINFEPNPSSDVDGNTVTYVGRICKDISCEDIVWQSTISPGIKSYADLTDNGYYLSCYASDGHDEKAWGTSIHISIDTQAPSVPVLLEEPPFTGSKENQLIWFPNEIEQVEYQVQYSERSDFRSYNAYSAWQRENRYVALHSKEKMFYYRVKSRDVAGNESVWSNIASTVIDSTFPLVKYFKTNKTLVSPKYTLKGEVTENAYIQGGGEDSTIDLILIEIANTNGKIVYSEQVEGKTYLWTHWPDKSGYPDGTYAARLIISDSIEHTIQSDPLLITIDSKPPEAPKIAGISDKQLLNSGHVTFSVSCKEKATITIYLGGKISGTGTGTITNSSNQKDGAHTLSANCTDIAGNKSTKTISFITDTSPPSPPTISYSLIEDSSKLQLKIYCREKGSAELFIHGVLLNSQNCEKNTYATYTLPEKITLPYYASFTARLSDIARNKSDLAEKTIYVLDQKDEPKQRVCSAVYDLKDTRFTQVNCNWEQEDISYKLTTSNGASNFISSFNVRANRLAKIQLTVFGCKQKSLWDPRTWTSCIREKIEERSVDGKITPLFTSNYDTVPVSNSQIRVLHPKAVSISIKKQYLLQFSAQLNAEYVSTEKLSPTFDHEYTLDYTKVSSKKYFSWIFSSTKSVSQWHGNTAYQKPHGGIDFSVANEPIKSPAQGKVISVGYDKKNECNSGGNYVGIQHSNGFYTYYFHLKSTKMLNGKSIKKGDSINRSQTFSQSGNSGMYNCLPLAPHLHFEVRKSASSTSHVNPVPYIDVDWGKIPTANIARFPGRLTGDNPHPKF